MATACMISSGTWRADSAVRMTPFSRVADFGEALALGREELVALQRLADHDRLVAYLEKS